MIDINDQISHAITAVDHHRVMLESIKRESPVLTKLRDSFAADINYEVRYACTHVYALMCAYNIFILFKATHQRIFHAINVI